MVEVIFHVMHKQQLDVWGTLRRSPASISDCRSLLRLVMNDRQQSRRPVTDDQKQGIWMYLSLRDKTCRRNMFKAGRGLVYPAHSCLSRALYFSLWSLFLAHSCTLRSPSAPQPLLKEPLACFYILLSWQSRRSSQPAVYLRKVE